MIAWRRARAHATPLVALALVALLLSGLVVGIVGGLSAAATSTVREQTERLRGADGALRVSIRVSGDGREQDLRVRALIARTTAGAPVDVIRTLGTNDSVDSRIAGHADELLPVSIPGLSDAAHLTAGEWPASDDQVAVQADAAKRLDLHSGSALRIGSADLRVRIEPTGCSPCATAPSPREGATPLRPADAPSPASPILLHRASCPRAGIRAA